MFVLISMIHVVINRKLTEDFSLKRERMSTYDPVYIVETGVYFSPLL